MDKVLAALLVIGLAVFFIVASGCAKLPAIPPELVTNYQDCMVKSHSIAIAEAKNIPVFKDDRDFIIWRLTANDKIYGEHCDDVIISFLRENGVVIASSNRVWSKGIGAGALVGGIYAGGNAIEGILGAAGAATTYNLSGSRAVFANGANLGGSGGTATLSASGDGEIYGNTQAINNDKVLQFPANNAESNNDPGGSNNNNINDAENVSDVDAQLGL